MFLRQCINPVRYRGFLNVPRASRNNYIYVLEATSTCNWFRVLPGQSTSCGEPTSNRLITGSQISTSVMNGSSPGWIRVFRSSKYKYMNAMGTTTTQCCRIGSLSNPSTSTKTHECSSALTSFFKATADKAVLGLVVGVAIVVGAAFAILWHTKISCISLTGKREDYLDWNDYFMAIAFLSAQRSKDPNTQVGACIVNQKKRIVGTGYNGMPDRCPDDEMPWRKSGEVDDILKSKKLYVCHAEMNAVLNKNSFDVTGCVIYVSLFPCNECTKILIQAGIKEVVYYSDKYQDKPEVKASKKMFNLAGVSYRQYTPKKNPVVIKFESINGTPGSGLDKSSK